MLMFEGEFQFFQRLFVGGLMLVKLVFQFGLDRLNVIL